MSLHRLLTGHSRIVAEILRKLDTPRAHPFRGYRWSTASVAVAKVSRRPY